MTRSRDSLLRREILSQPDVLERFRTREGPRAQTLGGQLERSSPVGVLICARGSSDHAAVYAKYLFGARLRVPVALAAPSLVTRYGAAPCLEDWLVIGISQSGASPDIAAVLESARTQGCLTLALTDRPDSPLGRVASEVLELHVGEEQSVAATATFTATLYALAHLACGWGGGDGSGELDAVPDRVRLALGTEPRAETLARDLAATQACVILGRGFGFPVALEWALKLKEVARVWAEPYSAADYRHGPIALASPAVTAILIDPDGPGRPDLCELGRELADRGVRPVWASDDPDCELPFPGGPEWLAPVPAVVPGQLLALHLAWARDLDPDHPVGITKVTRTL